MAEKPPPEGTTLEAWRFVAALRIARTDRGLPPTTIGLASTRHLTLLILESGLDEELWSRIPANAAETERRYGVTFRQLFFGPKAALIFEGLADGPWERKDGDQRRDEDYKRAAAVRAETVDLGLAPAAKDIPAGPSPEEIHRQKQQTLAMLARLGKEST